MKEFFSGAGRVIVYMGTAAWLGIVLRLIPKPHDPSPSPDPETSRPIMSLSLREQLLQAGLGSKKQAKQAEHQQRQQQHVKSKTRVDTNAERDRLAKEAQARKAARDQELNRQRQIAAERKERAAQIKQMIEQHRVPKPETDEYYNFIDRGKVQRTSVNAALREQLTRGELVLVRCEGRYDMVPAEIAARIRERDERAVVTHKSEAASDAVAPDDPYKDYVVPDDLTW